jgi:hypothetical protein
MSWSSNGATVWDDPTGCAVAGSILSAHFSQIKTKLSSPLPGSNPTPSAVVPIGLDSPVAPGFDSRTGNAHPDWIGTRVRFPLDPPPILSNPIGK